MQSLFLFLYDFFAPRKAMLMVVFISIIAGLGFETSQIKLEEDVSKFFPSDKKLEKATATFKNSRFADRVVVMIALADSLAAPNPELLIEHGELFATFLADSLGTHVKNIRLKADEATVLQFFETIHQHLPSFYTDADLLALDTLTSRPVVRKTLQKNLETLLSPSGLALKKFIAADPLSLTGPVLARLQQLQFNEGFTLYDNYFFTSDKRCLLLFLEPAYASNDIAGNSQWIEGVDDWIAGIPGQVSIEYFGVAAVAHGNAQQLRYDTWLTLSITILSILVVLYGFLRKLASPILVFIPVVFGALFSLALINLMQGTISVLAIAAGSMVLGIAVNYSLHFLSHLKKEGRVRQVLQDLVHPMTLGGATTVIAFLSLQFAEASLLSDIGLFAGLSLVGASLCSLIFLPHLVSDFWFGEKPLGWSAPHLMVNRKARKVVWWALLISLPVMAYFAGKVSFEGDMLRLNYMVPHLKKSETRLNQLSATPGYPVYWTTEGETLESALQQHERNALVTDALLNKGVVQRQNSIAGFLISDSLQQKRLLAWQRYWTAEKQAAFLNMVTEEAARLKFSKKAIFNIDSMISRRYTPVNARALQGTFLWDFVSDNPSGPTTIMAVATVAKANTQEMYAALGTAPNTHVFDRQLITNRLVALVREDFTFIVTTTSLIVFLVLFISYGRVELAVITFLPMVITWVLILGLMALFGIEFNIINIMVSTFIFGLGDDYSIFIMDGLQTEYKTGHKTLHSIEESIFLSAVTTVCGLGVLIFAQHPALKSIAAISILGIVSVFFVSQTVQPVLFNWLVAGRAQKNLPPITLYGLFVTILTYSVFVLGSLVLGLFGFVMFDVLRLKNKSTRLLFHKAIRENIALILRLGLNFKRHYINHESHYQSPAVIIANHQSHLDILLSARFSPKVILLTNDWVWNSPVFGAVVRLADFYPVDSGVEVGVAKLKTLVAEGYSIMVFPEGTRSANDSMKRFHKGAFYLAEQLQIPIVPMLIQGAGRIIRKGDIYIAPGAITIKFLPAIAPADFSFGSTYAERTKTISKYFKQQFGLLSQEVETPEYWSHQVVHNFLYKGPVLEWYMRVKIKLENYYAPFHALVPMRGSVLDLGCGYGFMDYTLAYLSAERQITAVDYDSEKIAVARHGYGRPSNLNFIAGDITEFSLALYDAILICDTLHYLSPAQQSKVLDNCLNALKPGGRLIIRDGDKDLIREHRGTKITELFSVKLLGFNKATQPLSFLSGSTLQGMMEARGYRFQRLVKDKWNSNVIFVIDRQVL